MKFVVCVGNYNNPNRLALFLRSISKTKDIDMHDIYIINTAKHNKHLDTVARVYGIDVISMGIDDPVAPAKQMKLRMDVMNNVCDFNTILCNFDDDYQFNPHWLNFSRKIFESDPTIHYLTLLKLLPGCGMTHNDHVGDRFKSCNFNFAWVKSAMGGSFMVRWIVFKKHMDMFFERYGFDGQYDGDFWNIINESYQKPYNVCMLMDFSLYQHCNLISQYGHHWPHTYGADFDPIVNPFEVPIR
jgi:hypothetical protein